jgi:DNA modification methylase
MKTYLTLSNTHPHPLPVEFAQEPDVRFSETLARHFLDQFTFPGDVVLDPFAGFGTTLLAAEEMGRLPFGVEYDEPRVRYIKKHLQKPTSRILHGDSRLLSELNLPPVDFSLTSPPYMARGDVEDPLSAYSVPGQGYEAYLLGVRSVYAQMAALLKPGAKAVIEVANIKSRQGVTPLAWDVARVVSEVLDFEGESVVCWEPTYGFGYDHSYCLLFGKP